MESTHIEGGFTAPVLDGQAVFRAVMDAMSRPGTVQKLAAGTNPPAPLAASAAAVALTLCDHDTPVWLDPALKGVETVSAWLSFQTGAPYAHTPADAHFALIAEPATMISLDNFAQGSQDYPDRSTTLILQVETLEAGAVLTLEGPGIETATRLAPGPMPRHFVEQWRQNNARFPRGVDVILAAPGAVACLPRTTRISTTEA
ncbi:phosphonate C-P lyase system protein PhnH [Aliihoeflea aestuarii]|jgi:alpha-D-ribose 1-methylphosphonate 5-triphosphate synthase subunit PhnH|uniref:phosphonate C-P lyase system protein PhnH n=1 Tax=Aliihoeflea aestuarii TaxID=453840 RepID=UPI002092F8AB|nr:phosphonate C-P lyase system protein PhnH [Aliihoeflea aestuarii]MCO6390621.1 phosphonate C-P lyase system protein PhnH [Aliihoeflea aestuarii]